jgi:thiamine pyrophosphate-dependent acetolactate synthase large subunit-like protein
MKAAEAVAQVLKQEGTEQVFCFPSNPLIDAVAAAGIRPIVGREERTVINMADAYSRITNGRRIGVCMVQSGPGIEHAFGSIAQAYADSVPLLLLPGGAARDRLGLRSSFDATVAYGPVAKWAARFETARSVPEQLRRAFAHLRSGRPGPVVLEMPADVTAEELPEPLEYQAPVRARSAADPAAVTEAVRLLLGAERPLLHAGQGVLWAEASDELVELAELVQAPVMTTYIGKSAFPEDHPLSIGAGGAAVSPGVQHFLPRSDLVLSVGSSLLRTLGCCGIPAGRPIIQCTADPDDLGVEYPVACGLVGDAKLVLAQLCEEVRRQGGSSRSGDRRAAQEVAAMRKEAADQWRPLLTSDEAPINPYRLFNDLMATLDPAESIVTHDSGYPRDQLTPFYVSTRPRGYLGWGNTTPLGSSLGLALGAKLAAPDKTVVNVMGDAAFGQSGLDVETGVRNGIPILSIVLNNFEMGNYEKMQPIAQERYGIKHLSGNYAEVARSLGVHTERVERPDELVPALKQALAEVAEGRSALVEVMTRAEPAILRL